MRSGRQIQTHGVGSSFAALRFRFLVFRLLFPVRSHRERSRKAIEAAIEKRIGLAPKWSRRLR
jgi:hypothetical protein